MISSRTSWLGAACLYALAGGGCQAVLESASPLEFDCDPRGSATVLLTDSMRRSLEGVYVVESGREEFGEELVARWSVGSLGLHSNSDARSITLCSAVVSDTTLALHGSYRFVRSGKSGGVVLRKTLLSDTLEGLFDDRYRLTLRRRDSLAPEEDFLVIAHRGGGRNSDRLGRSENSLEMIRYAEHLGANGVEVDVMATKDRELILFHDETFSPRTVQGGYLLGPVTAFTLNDIQKYGRLIHGETVPTLWSALETVIRDTKLRFLWLDVKDPTIVDGVLALWRRAQEYSDSMGRSDLSIVIGIPSVDALSAWRNCLARLGTSTPEPVFLCELGVGDAISLRGCRYWAPRWSNAPGGSEFAVARDSLKNYRVQILTWTVDVAEYMDQFIGDGYHGLLTNYPSMLAGKVRSRR